jgi:RNA recognition motif-containing protein
MADAFVHRTVARIECMSKKIYVGNLPWATTSSDLEAMFQEFGEVTSAEVIQDRETGRSRGFGFVQMPTNEDADAAMNALNGKDMGGRPLVVNEARERERGAGGGGGRSYGGGSGGGYGGGGGVGGYGGGGGGYGGGAGGGGRGDRGDRR